MKSAFASVIGFGIGNLFSRIGLSQETGNSNKNADLNGVFIEAGSFDEFGGWILDTQFIEIMGSTYLMAHGLGKPVHSSGYWGTWAWEGGYYRHPINDLEYIRDWNFRAVFGAWNAVKNKEKASEYINARLAGLVAIGGPRESRRLLGDYVLTGNDMINRVEFDDGFVPVTWYLDRHFPDEKYNKKYPDDPFIARADHKFGTNREDRPRHGAPWWGIPYRCLYSRNISNLFMAGRNISTNYWALGAVRVMRTCGMMGEIIGKAASVCVEKNCQPGDVYYSHLSQLRKAL